MAEKYQIGEGEPIESVDAVATQWSCHKRTLIREIERGNLRALKLAGKWMVPASEKRDYLQRKMNQTEVAA